MNEEQKRLFEELRRMGSKLNDAEDRRDFERELSEVQRKYSSTTTNNTSTGNDSRGRGGGFELSKVIGSAIDAARVQSSAPENTDYITELLNNISNSSRGAIGSVAEGMIKTAFDGVEDYVAEQSYLLSTVNTELNLAGKLSQDFRERITEAQPDLVRMGIPFKDLTQSVERLVEDTGRFALVGTEMLTRAGEIASAYGMNMEDVIGSYADFERVGIGASQAQESIADAGKRSLELGIQSRQTIQGMIENIGKLNEYGFANGAEGLEKMVRRATEVRMNLESVFKVADKVFDPEGALELSANLQVLGAAFGDFNDPIRLMYMATNEVEGLQGALEGVAQNLATYNVETGGFEVTGVQLRQAREIANQLGVDLKDITDTAIALQERGQVDMALSGLQISEEDKEFLTNISRMKDGEMQIELMTPELQEKFGGASVTLEKLSQEGVNQLLEYRQQFQELSEPELVRQQVTLIENVSRDVNYLATLARLRAAGVGDALFESFAKMDFKDAGVNYSEVLKMDVDKLAESFDKAAVSQIGQIQKEMGLDEKMKAFQTAQENLYKQGENKTVTHKHEHNVKSDQLVGRFNKEWSLNPEQWTGGTGYLNNN